MKNLLLIISLFVMVSLSAQSYTRTWRTCFDNGRRNAARTPLQAAAADTAGNLYIAGYVNLYPDQVNDSIYLRKYSPNGNLLWEVYELFKATTAWNLSVPLTLTADNTGNVILSYSFSFIQSNLDAVINKYSATGAKLWQTIFDGPEAVDNEQVRKLTLDDKGNVYLLVAENFNYGTLVKMNAKGKILWYRDMKGLVVDGTFTDFQVKDATIDSSGNVYATGLTARLHNGNYHDALTYKFFTNGDSAWRVRYGVNYTDHSAYKVLYAQKDNSIVIGGQVNNQNRDSVFALKYTAGGRQLWSYTGNNTSTGFVIFGGLAVDADNNMILATNYSTFPSPAPLLTKLSSSGSVLWSKYAFQPDGSNSTYYIYDLKTDAQSHYYAVSNQPKGVLIQKFGTDGSLLAQANEGLDTSVEVNYAALQIAKNETIYAATSYEFYYARTNSCISRYTLKNAGAKNETFYTETNILKTMGGNTNLVYPNPAHNVVYLPAVNPIGSEYTISVYDAMGKQVIANHNPAYQNKVDISSLSKGVYLITMMVDTKSFTYKFIKE